MKSTNFMYMTLDDAEDCLYDVSDKYTVLQRRFVDATKFLSLHYDAETECEMIIEDNTTHEYFLIPYLINDSSIYRDDAFKQSTVVMDDGSEVVRCKKVVKTERLVYDFV